MNFRLYLTLVNLSIGIAFNTKPTGPNLPISFFALPYGVPLLMLKEDFSNLLIVPPLKYQVLVRFLSLLNLSILH